MLGGPLPPKPSRVLAQHLWVCPFPEDDVAHVIDTLRPNHVLFGSDYPHPEGLRQPGDFIQRLTACDPATTQLVLHTNTAQLLHLAPTPHPLTT
jgi:predicted TIM-barrel fold metal-dependent hydrolase